MPDQNKQRESQSPARHAEIDNTQNLLHDFGAAPKKAAAPKALPVAESTESDATVRKTAANEKTTANQAPKKENQKKATPKKASAQPEDAGFDRGQSASNTTKKANTATKPREEQKASTADPAMARRPRGNTKKATENTIDLDNQPRSSRTAHRVIPYALIILAVIIGVSLLLNIVWFSRTDGTGQPDSHPMGLVGFYICRALFGVFGPAVFTLPLLMLNLAFFWKRYIDRKVAIAKLAVSTAFLLLFGALIHVCCLQSLKKEFPLLIDAPASELFGYGAEMTGGGVLGGALGAFFMRYFSFIGSLVVGILLLLASLLYILGLTPERIWEYMRTRRQLRRDMLRTHPIGVSEQDAELARDRARMQEKLRKTAAPRQMDIDDEQYYAEPAAEGSEKTEKAEKSEKTEKAPRQKKNPEDKLAPMPVPHLNPGSDNRLFVPVDVTRKLREAERAGAAAPAAAAAAPSPSTAAVSKETAPAKPTPDPAQNRDAAVDPIFPKTGDSRTLSRTPKEDRNFDLKHVFINLDDRETAVKPHAPVPPEVPPAGARAGAQRTRPQPAAPGGAGQARPAQPPKAPQQPSDGKAPSLSAIRQAPAGMGASAKADSGKTVFRKASNAGPGDFGLSSEEFEKLEASRTAAAKRPTGVAKPGDAKSAPDGKKTAATAKAAAQKPTAPKKYVFPPISYLQPGVPMTAENRAEIEDNMRQLAATLESFRVRVQEINYSCGPTVTRYEVVLAAGVRVRNITNLADDIALALRSPGGVRIEAPIPGTNAVGIEVPNKTRSTIYLRDMIESKAFSEAKSKLSACLGADIAGQPLVFDIAKMPHLLIAGTTGSGKSVCINCILMSLLYKVRPDEVKLVLIDPKKVEFSIYKNIPHLMAPVVNQPKDAAGALQAAVEEMERRFEVFEGVGVRDLKGYNEITKNDPDMPYIPHIVIIIDELADLMMTAKNEVETAICRIAQKARAAGMHLIIGTQRPSADVVTGLIKANVPSSIAFAVKSQIDSRVILDHGGAEALVGRGDMLFVPIGSMRDTRVQGAFVEDKEVERICEFIRVTNGSAQYDERFTAKLKELAAQCGNKGKTASEDLPSGDAGGDDSKYEEAVQIALEENRVATSLLQRKLGIGYSRAAKIIDRMQAEGIVSAPDGSKPRTILMSHEQYLDWLAKRQAEKEQQ